MSKSDHERLDVYKAAIRTLALTSDESAEAVRRHAHSDGEEVGLGLGLGLGLDEANRSKPLWRSTRSPNGLGGGAEPGGRHFEAGAMSVFEVLERGDAAQVERVLSHAAVTGAWALATRDVSKSMLDGHALA